MQTQKLNHDQFTAIMGNQPDLYADSATYCFFDAFWEFLFTDGGDDDFASENSNYIALLMACFVTPQDIEAYDNADEDNEQDIYMATYQRIKQIIL